MNALPKVASNFHTDCKKCGQERYHKVLAHTSSTAAKVECEVCHSKKTYKLNEGNSVAKAAKKAPKKRTKGPSAGEIQNAKFKELLEKIGDTKPQPYRMASVYSVDAKIEHPKFGVGFVAMSFPDKIEVVFEDVNRQLVQGRK
jgi:hypothetical protein